MKKYLLLLMAVVFAIVCSVVSYALPSNWNMLDSVNTLYVNISDCTEQEKAFVQEWDNLRKNPDTIGTAGATLGIFRFVTTSTYTTQLILFIRGQQMNSTVTLNTDNAQNMPRYINDFHNYPVRLLAFNYTGSNIDVTKVFLRSGNGLKSSSSLYYDYFLKSVSSIDSIVAPIYKNQIPQCENVTITNIVFKDSPPPTSSSSSSSSSSIPYVPIKFPTIGKVDNELVPYDTTIWNTFLDIIKKYINDMLPSGLKLFVFVLAMIFIATLLKVIRDSIYKGSKV